MLHVSIKHLYCTLLHHSLHKWALPNRNMMGHSTKFSGQPFEGLDTGEFKCGTDYITLSMSHSSNYLAPPGKLAIKRFYHATLAVPSQRHPSCWAKRRQCKTDSKRLVGWANKAYLTPRNSELNLDRLLL